MTNNCTQFCTRNASGNQTTYQCSCEEGLIFKDGQCEGKYNYIVCIGQCGNLTHFLCYAMCAPFLVFNAIIYKYLGALPYFAIFIGCECQACINRDFPMFLGLLWNINFQNFICAMALQHSKTIM